MHYLFKVEEISQYFTTITKLLNRKDYKIKIGLQSCRTAEYARKIFRKTNILGCIRGVRNVSCLENFAYCTYEINDTLF